MSNGYGQLVLLLLAIGLIFLAASGKGRQIYAILTGSGTSTYTPGQRSYSGGR